jgi:hypothetical protein
MDSIEENLGISTASTNMFLKGVLLSLFDQWKPVLTACNWLSENV